MNAGILTQSQAPQAGTYPLLGNLTPVPLPNQLALDAEAVAYLAAVEAADGRPLENSVRAAVNAFIVGCKADGIWSAVKASCILCGARTLAGALTPLVGPTPANTSFVSADYSRSSGLRGGLGKRINTNRNVNEDPQNFRSCGVWVTDMTQTGSGTLFDSGASAGSIRLVDFQSQWFFRLTSNAIGTAITPNASGLHALARNSSPPVSVVLGRYAASASVASSSAASENVLVCGGTTTFTTARIALYWVGEFVPLRVIEARISTLVNSIGAALS